jgi:hypothetical protein
LIHIQRNNNFVERHCVRFKTYTPKTLTTILSFSLPKSL